MPNEQNTETAPVTAEEEHAKDERDARQSRKAAAAEAAYILEAIRR